MMPSPYERPQIEDFIKRKKPNKTGLKLTFFKPNRQYAHATIQKGYDLSIPNSTCESQSILIQNYIAVQSDEYRKRIYFLPDSGDSGFLNFPMKRLVQGGMRMSLKRIKQALPDKLPLKVTCISIDNGGFVMIWD